jgi:hypothetical protein
LGYAWPMRIRSLLAIAGITIALCMSCSSSSSSTTPPAAGAVTQAIGPEGGKIEIGGAVVTFPKGAVAAQTSVTISVQDASTAPAGFVALSKVFKCEPAGTDFAQPVEMRMPFVDDGKGGSLFWSSGADPAFKDLGGKIEGSVMVATVKHFSGGFVGRKE